MAFPARIVESKPLGSTSRIGRASVEVVGFERAPSSQLISRGVPQGDDERVIVHSEEVTECLVRLEVGAGKSRREVEKKKDSAALAGNGKLFFDTNRTSEPLLNDSGTVPVARAVQCGSKESHSCTFGSFRR